MIKELIDLETAVFVLAALKALDVIVKATPTTKDDFVVDVLGGILRKFFKIALGK